MHGQDQSRGKADAQGLCQTAVHSGTLKLAKRGGSLRIMILRRFWSLEPKIAGFGMLYEVPRVGDLQGHVNWSWQTAWPVESLPHTKDSGFHAAR